MNSFMPSFLILSQMNSNCYTLYIFVADSIYNHVAARFFSTFLYNFVAGFMLNADYRLLTLYNPSIRRRYLMLFATKL